MSYPSQLYRDYLINHEIRIPFSTNQDSRESRMYFFRSSPVITYTRWAEKHPKINGVTWVAHINGRIFSMGFHWSYFHPTFSGGVSKNANDTTGFWRVHLVGEIFRDEVGSGLTLKRRMLFKSVC